MNIPVINLFHALIVGPLLAYIGYNRETTPKMIFDVLLYTGLIVIIYHSFLSYRKITNKKK